MLQIRRLSGEELTIALEEDLVPDVTALKRRLNQLHGLPPRFGQRLLLHGTCLEDTATLHPGMELELVMLPFISNPSPDEVQEFIAAAGAGDFDQVRAENGTYICTPHGVNRSCSVEGLCLETEILRSVPGCQVESLLKLPMDPDETEFDSSVRP